jgi:GrpB-like predicted nucleotidyltransferase (UPF0157 family)
VTDDRVTGVDEATSNEKIATAHIKPPEVLDGPITLVDYDPDWDALYLREAARIRAALSERLLLIEHVGSTAVPGLTAKPKVDIVVAVIDSSIESDYVRALEARGYVLRIREPDWHEHRLFDGPDTVVNLHVFSEGCEEIERLLRFRDHLRRNETDRMLYASTKRALARQTWKYTQNYADAKSMVVEEILARSSDPDEHDLRLR